MAAHTPTFTPPYPPSWVDRLTQRITRLPGPDWLYYAGLWFVLFSLHTTVQWREGSYPLGTFNPFHLVVTASAPVLLLLNRHLNLTAANALAKARPLLTLNKVEFEVLAYRFTTLPFRAALGVSLLPLLSPLLDIFKPLAFFEDAQVALTPLSVAMTLALTTLVAVCVGAVLYQMYRQTRMVSQVYRTCVQVDLFHLSPLYGFSRLTSQAALALIVLASAYYFAEPSLLEDVDNVLILILGTLISCGVFILPLVGAHNRILAEKERMLAETTKRIAIAIDKLHRAIDEEDWPLAEQVRSTLTGLESEQQLVGRIATWPWQPETPRLILTALLLPIVLFVVQYLIQRLLAP